MTEFNDDASIGVMAYATPEPQDAVSRRSIERDVVSYLGIASYGDGELTQVNLVDLSASGARMIAPSHFVPQTEFVLKVPETGACFLSEVAWRNGATYGIRFLSPVLR